MKLTEEQLEQYEELCDIYLKEDVNTLLDLLGTEELFDGIPRMLEDS